MVLPKKIFEKKKPTQRQQSTEQKAHIWDLDDLGSGDSFIFLASSYITLDRSLDLRLGLLICKTVRNTVPSSLPKTYQEVIIIKLILLQVQIPKTFLSICYLLGTL